MIVKQGFGVLWWCW